MGFIKRWRWVLLKGAHRFYETVQMDFIKVWRWVLLEGADGLY